METNSIETIASPALSTLAKANPTRAELIDVIIDEIDAKLQAANNAINARLEELEKVEFTAEECANSLKDVKYTLGSYSGALRMNLGRGMDLVVDTQDAKVFAVAQEMKELRKQQNNIRHHKCLVEQPRKIKAYITKRLLEQSKDGCTLLEALKNIANTFTASTPIE
jgi:hypothetical protein